MRKFAPRKSLRDAKLAANAADRYYAAMFGKEPMAQSQVKPKRVIKNRTAEEDLEKGVIREVKRVVFGHRNVIWALRMNSGQLLNPNGQPVTFNKWIKNDDGFLIADIFGFATFGWFALEAKERFWTWTGTEREVGQKAFIDWVISTGGRGGFVTSAEGALAILK